jgi:diguanylate cyclase (GGDEF)-like protein/PAS domain S-box-containing protein
LRNDNTIHLLIVHESEEDAERILSILRNAQIAVRPTRITDEEQLSNVLERQRFDLVLCQDPQQSLPLPRVIEEIERSGKDIPVIALIDNLNEESIDEAIAAGASTICNGNLSEHLRHTIRKEKKALDERRRLRFLESELREAEKRSSALLENSKDAIAYVHDGMHMFANKSYQELFGYEDEEELEVTPFLNLVTKADVPKTKKLLKQISKNELPDSELTFTFQNAKGEEFEAEVTVQRATVDGEPCAQFMIRPPSINPEAEKELRELKFKDIVTGFYNRRYFTDLLKDELSKARAGQPGVSLALLQVDKEKQLEQQLGKAGMDLLMTSLAQYLQHQLPENATPVRYSETAFLIVAPIKIEEMAKLSEAIRRGVTEQLFEAGDESISTTLSIGVTQLVERTESAKQVMKTLQDQVISAKDKGGNLVSVFDPAEEEKKARAANQHWIDLIEAGIGQDRFVLHYQPIISLHGDDTEHYEALVRLKTPDGLAFPGDFLPIAKRHGYMPKIDKWVTRRALQQIKEHPEKVTVFLKLSPDSYEDISFPAWLSNELKQRSMTGERLVLQIPESELVTHSAKVKPVINALKNLHCKFAVEKFGSGLNSFMLLKHYPIDLLKFDPSFTRNLAENDENQQQIKDMVEKAHAQGKQVVCEHVEDATSMSFLWKCNVNYVQGNFLAPAQETMSQDNG